MLYSTRLDRKAALAVEALENMVVAVLSWMWQPDTRKPSPSQAWNMLEAMVSSFRQLLWSISQSVTVTSRQLSTVTALSLHS